MKNISIILILFVLSSSSVVADSISWNEDFQSDLSNWEMYRYETNSSTFEEIEGSPSIKNDELQFHPDIWENTTSQIWRNSSVEYGTWSLDVYLSNKTNQYQAIQISFITNQKLGLNYTGKTTFEILQNHKSFTLFIVWGIDPWITGVQKDDLLFIFRYYSAYTSCDQASCLFTDLAYKDLGPLTYNGMHKITITKDFNNEIKFWMDSEKILTYEDYFHLRCEQFGIISLGGLNIIDNIKATTTISSPAASTETHTIQATTMINLTYITGMVLTFLFVMVLIQKRTLNLK